MDNPFLFSAHFYIYDLISILIIYQSLIFGFFLLIKQKSKTRLTNILILIYATIFIHFGYILIENNWLSESYMLGVFFGFIYGPLFYLYTQSLILKKVSLKRIYFHFTPSIVALITIVILSYFDKNILLRYNAFASILVTIHLISYLSNSLLLLKEYKIGLKHFQSSFDRISLNWLRAIIYIILSAILLAFLQSIVSATIPAFIDLLITIIFILILVLINSFYYLGLRQVELFSGFDHNEIQQEHQKGKYEIPDGEKATLLKELSHYIEIEQPYRQFEISLNDIAVKLSSSPRKISFLINDTYGMNFFEFINSFRIEEVKKLLQNTDKSIKEIMYDCGFGNKSTFNSIFKKFTNHTPSSYRNNRS